VPIKQVILPVEGIEGLVQGEDCEIIGKTTTYQISSTEKSYNNRKYKFNS